MVKIKVNLKERSYEIVVGNDSLAQLGEIVAKNSWGREVFVVTDPLVNELHGVKLTKALAAFDFQVIEVQRGEKNKNLRVMSKLYDQLVKASAHRDALVIAFGGGVIGDMAGFLAATYMRGINFIQVPTTLLAQVDAAIGGKTGVNHPKGKNLIGSFFQPRLVFADVALLSTLSARELQTGLAEVVKYGVMEDNAFFKFLEENSHHLNTNAFKSPDTKRAALKVWETIVAESAKIKARVVEKDEQESQLRMVLNLGHTVGHAIETVTNYKQYNHGEAVAIGLVAAARIAVSLNMLDEVSLCRIENLLDKLNLPRRVENITCRKVLKTLMIDKKVRAGKVHFVLPKGIGSVVIRDDVPGEAIRNALKEIGCK